MKRSLMVALVVGLAAVSVSCGSREGSDDCTKAQRDAAQQRCKRCLDSCSGCNDPGAACVASCRPCDQ